MNLDELRRALVKEHDALRVQLDELDTLARLLQAGVRVPDGEGHLRGLLHALRAALEDHCVREAVVLKPIIAEVDAWGPERVDILEREHLAEHDALVAGIGDTARSEGARTLGAATIAMTRALRAHMEVEEKYLLHPDILTDSIIKSIQLTD